MKRVLLIFAVLFLFNFTSFAAHITGGQIFYTYAGLSGGNHQYNVTLWLYRDSTSPGAPIDPTAAIAVFDKATGTMVWSNSVPLLDIFNLRVNSPDPCITNPPNVSYQVGRYIFTLSLPANAAGYVITYQRCCRITGINNLINSSTVGATYTADIPGTLSGPTAPVNNSARFTGSDTVIVCADNAFTYSFAATDPDGDNLVYSFCDAYTGGSQGMPAPNPPAPPPYSLVPYALPFSGSSPLGPTVTLNTTTGLISGIAPIAGIYVVTVCVQEIRNGLVIATQRKDLQIKVGDCDIADAELLPKPATCDGFTVSFSNDAPPSPLINSYFWDFGVPWLTNDTSTLQNPTYTYPDTGVFIVKLVTNRNQPCSDSATTPYRVFPGFFPGFVVSGACFTNPFQFTDTTNTRYGVVDSWSWNFGDPSTSGDTSHLQNPSWTYAGPGLKTVSLIVTNSKGCVDTANVDIDVFDKPPIGLAFRDTLICRNDAVQLSATGTGSWSWTPNTNISNPNSPNPTVNPPTTTWYYVRLNDRGCINTDSVQVRVVANVTLQARPDTTICLTDPVQLYATSDGLTFQWSPAGTLNDPNIMNPIATPTQPTTNYQVTATIGSCSATDFVTVYTVPYPLAMAGPDDTICYNSSMQLNASHDGSSFSWSPVTYLNNPNILNPIASPPRTTRYVFTVYDTVGCPKPGRDSITVFVSPRFRAFAGRDTTVVVNQPLQFNATGGVSYFWTPSTGLNNPNIFNPVGIYGAEIDSVRYTVIVGDAAGCLDSAFVIVRVFKTVPSVFVPTAFTPNGNGLNDVIRPIAVGIQKINHFNIYNRWGQLVFHTTVNGHGWDGRIKGREQGSAVFLWTVDAIDYLGRKYFAKGTVTLIR